MKKIVCVALVIVLLSSCILVLSSCNTNTTEKKIKIVTTIFPIYDWVREVIKGNEENVELTMLIDKGVDLHSYQGTVDDIIKVSTCDIFIYVGGESDKWADKALKNITNKNMVVINLMDSLGEMVKEEEVIEGMEEKEEHNEEDNEDKEYDEHVWLSLRNASYLVKTITSELKKIDEKHSSLYDENSLAYVNKLENLDKQYGLIFENKKQPVVVFGDRFPFRYFVDDYNITYYGAFVGCSAESEASFETIAFLANKLDEYDLNYIFKIESSDGKIANTIINNSKSKNQEIISVNSMQSITKKDVDAGVTYYSIMEDNLKAFEKGTK